MHHSTNSDSTLSPTSFSPFSSGHSFASEGGTSDEPADLGQFASVFRALNEIQNGSRSVPIIQSIIRPQTPTSSVRATVSDTESDAEGFDSSTVWTNGNLEDYLSSTSSYRNGRNLSSERDSALSDTEGEDDVEGDERQLHGNMTDNDRPTLGILDGVLGFLAAERAKLDALRDARASSSQASTSENAWRHVIEPRRKRRRKRGRHTSTNTSVSRQELEPVGETADHGLDGDGADVPIRTMNDGSSSEPDVELDVNDVSSSPTKGKSLPASPQRLPLNIKRRQKGILTVGDVSNIAKASRLVHSRSTPSLRPVASASIDPGVLRLRTLAKKLCCFFPDDMRWLSSVPLDEVLGSQTINTRGPPPTQPDPLIHVFVDHSNILIGFINHLKRNSMLPPRHTKPYLWHAALTLILERGRPVSRRVLATSSPLYQPTEPAEQLGYEVRVYARVPDAGDGADRVQPKVQKSRGRKANALLSRNNTTGHLKRPSNDFGSTSAESDPGVGGISTDRLRAHSRDSSLTGQPLYSNGIGSGSTPRIRYREQGVDELLQLKLLQAIADVDVPPKGSTVILATGDGNVGQFNEDGFIGCVRTALKKGWKVELCAWEIGLSKAWEREFGEGRHGDRFKIILLDAYGDDLLEIS